MNRILIFIATVIIYFCGTACNKKNETIFFVGQQAILSEINILDFDSVSNSDQEMIQMAIDYASNNGIDVVYVPDGIYEIDAAGVYGPKGIALKDGITLKLDSSAILRAIPNNATNYSVIRVHNVNDVKIMGGTIEGDRNTHIGTSGEWGMGIDVRESTNVEIYNTLVKNCWGDGIYIGGTSPSMNVRMELVTCDSNRRQGISVVHGDGIFLKNSVLSNTRGKAPQAGIDLEPNIGQYVANVEIVGTSFIKNTGPGFFAYAGTGQVYDILIRDCFSDNNSHAGINFNGGSPIGVNKNLRNVRLSNILITRNPLLGLLIKETDNISVDSITIVDSRQKAVSILNSENISFNTFNLNDVRQQGVVITNSDSVTFKKGQIDNVLSNVDGVTVVNSRSTRFSDVSINGGSRGVVAQNVEGLTVDSLDILSQVLYGIWTDSTLNTKILNSQFETIAQSPVLMVNSVNGQIRENTFVNNCFQSHNTYAHIFIDGISSNNIINDNLIQDGSHTNKSKYGIWLGVATYANSITSNSIDLNSFSVLDIYDESGNNTIN